MHGHHHLYKGSSTGTMALLEKGADVHAKDYCVVEPRPCTVRMVMQRWPWHCWRRARTCTPRTVMDACHKEGSCRGGHGTI